jgi:ribosome-associated protein
MRPDEIESMLRRVRAECAEFFIRASGPGGQNVNKVASAVELRLDVRRSPSIPAAVKTRLRLAAGRRMTAEGILIIKSDRFRSQEQNRDDARERLELLLRQAAVPPRRRIKTKPTRASQERRLQQKKERSAVKRERGGRPSEE